MKEYHVYECKITATVETFVPRKHRDGRAKTDQEMLEGLNESVADHVKDDYHVDYVGATRRYETYKDPECEYSILKVEGVEPLGNYDTELSSLSPYRPSYPVRIFHARMTSTLTYCPEMGYDWRFWKHLGTKWVVRGSMSMEKVEEHDWVEPAFW